MHNSHGKKSTYADEEHQDHREEDSGEVSHRVLVTTTSTSLFPDVLMNLLSLPVACILNVFRKLAKMSVEGVDSNA